MVSPLCLCLPAALVLGLGSALGEAALAKGLPGQWGRWVGKGAAKRGGGFLRLQNSSVADVGVTSLLGRSTEQHVAGVAYCLGGDTGARFNM